MSPLDFACPFCLAPKGRACATGITRRGVHVAREKAAGRWALTAIEAPCPACKALLSRHEIRRAGSVLLWCPNE